MAEAGADVVGVDWRVPLDRARARLGDRRRRAGQPRPRRLPGARGTWSPRQAGARARRQRRPSRATSSTWAGASCPRPTPTSSAASSTSSMRRPQPDGGGARRRAGDGLRHAGHARRHRGRTTPTSAGAGRRTPEQLADLRGRYEAIGGTSPLLERTRAQAAGIAGRPGRRLPRRAGHEARPAVHRGRRGRPGRRRASPGSWAWCWPRTTRVLSVGEYAERAAAAAAEAGVELAMVESWHLAAGLPRPAGRLRGGRGRRPAAPSPTSRCVFTAHSLPDRILEARATRTRTSCARRRRRSPARPGASTGGRSAGRARAARPSRGSGPTSSPSCPALAADGAAGVVVCAAGFVSDHLEVLYDLDIEARPRPTACGLAFARTPSPNDDPAFCATLADVVRARAAAG